MRVFPAVKPLQLASLCAGVLVLLLSFASFTSQADGEQIYDCGVLHPDTGGTCLVFSARDGRDYLLSDYHGFGAGDTILVDGVISTGCPGPCGTVYPCIRYAAIDTCRYRDLGCGWLYDNPDDYCPPMLITELVPEGWGLDTYGSFSSGDTVRVLAWTYRTPPGWCYAREYSFLDRITTCEEPTPIARRSWGTLRMLFR
jgi:hypothetical protein